ISFPSVVLAYLKLRKRNLGPILDANGWAVNAKAKLNIPFGATLTSVAALPRGARLDKRDPYEERSPGRLLVGFVLLIVLGYTWYDGKLDRFLPDAAKSTQVLGSWAPKK